MAGWFPSQCKEERKKRENTVNGGST